MIALALTAVSCGEKKPVTPEEEKPVFPQLVEKSIKPGESATISFSANLDWEASMPLSESAFFHINDGGVKEYKVSGHKGQVSITVCAENVSGVYDIHTCSIDLKMGGETKTIAKVNLIPEQRTMAFYAAIVNADETFDMNTSGDFNFESSATNHLEMVWPRGANVFMAPLSVVANFDWAIVEDYPKWMEVTKTSSSDERTSLVVRGVATEYPADDAVGTLHFIDLKTGDPVAEISVKIPGCKDVMKVVLDTRELEFNMLGEYNRQGNWTSDGFSFYVTATPDSDVLYLQEEDGKYTWNNEPWLDITRSVPDQSDKAPKVQDLLFRVKAAPNSGLDRNAVLLAIPGYLLKGMDPSKDLIAADGSIKADYKKYQVVTLVQAGKDPSQGWGVVTPVNSAYKMAVKGAGICRTDSEDAYFKALNAKYGTDEIYTLSYNNWYSGEDANLAITEEFDAVEYMLPDGSRKDYYVNVSLDYPDALNKQLFRLNVDYFEEGYETAAVLKNGEKVVAIVIVRMTEEFWPDVKYTNIYFLAYDLVGEDGDPEGNILPQNVLLEQIKSGAVYDEYKAYDIPVWRLVYYTSTSERNAMICVPPFPVGVPAAVQVTPQPSWINVESALSESGKPYIHVSMSDKLPESGNVGRVVLVGGGRPLFVLVCERQFMNQ